LNEEKMDELLRLMRAIVPDTSDMSDAGKVGFVYKFDYDPAAPYEKLDVVKYGMSLWTPKTDTIGNPPPDQSQYGQEDAQENDFWVLFLPGALGSEYVKKTDISAPPTETESGKPGVNYPDGKTITIDENGMLTGAPTGRSLTKEEMNTQLSDGTLEDGSAVYLSGNEQDGDRGNMVGLIIDGQFVPYGMVGLRDGVPVYLFNTYEEYEAAKPNLVDPCVFITLDDLDTGGWTFDDALDPESENAVQNKALYAYISGIMTMEDPISFNGGAGYHNSIFRGKYLGDTLTQEQVAEIEAGTFKDMFVGDYWTIGGVNYRIAHLDYWLRCGDAECTKHHAVIVPDTCLYNAQMHNTASGQYEGGAANTTEGGYIGSDMYKTGLNQAKTIINNAFGSAHILSHRELLVNAVTNGRPSNNVWYDSTVELMNEPMVYGSYIFTPAHDGTVISYRYTIDKSQLALFALRPDLICNRVGWWLRDVVSGAHFANVYWHGHADCYYASNAFGVRPAFGVCGS